MEMLIVYYSLGGNTEWAARQIAARLNADVLRVEPVKGYPANGFRKYFWGGKSAMMAETPALQPYSVELSRYDCVILGFPVWAGNIAPPIRTFVGENDLTGKRVAAFCCQSGAGAGKAFKRLSALSGVGALEAALVLIDPKDKPSPENGKRLAAFCGALNG